MVEFEETKKLSLQPSIVEYPMKHGEYFPFLIKNAFIKILIAPLGYLYFELLFAVMSCGFGNLKITA